MRVKTDRTISAISVHDWVTFIRTPAGWMGAGWNDHGTVGVGHTDAVNTPTLLAKRKGMRRFASYDGATWAWDGDNILYGCGANETRQLGVFVNKCENSVTKLTTVKGLDGVTVRSIAHFGGSTLFITDAPGGCMAVGDNARGALADAGPFEVIKQATPMPPTPLDPPIEAAVSMSHVTIVRRGDSLWAAGFNQHRTVTADKISHATELTPFPIPGPAKRLFLGGYSCFVECTDGTWYGKGANMYGQLGAGTIAKTHSRWIPLPLDGVWSIETVANGDAFLFHTDRGTFATGYDMRIIAKVESSGLLRKRIETVGVKKVSTPSPVTEVKMDDEWDIAQLPTMAVSMVTPGEGLRGE